MNHSSNGKSRLIMKTTKMVSGIAVAPMCGLAATLKAQNIYVSNGNTIGEYGLNGSTVNASLISGLDNPWGIAIRFTTYDLRALEIFCEHA
jgi:hypothetical protein